MENIWKKCALKTVLEVTALLLLSFSAQAGSFSSNLSYDKHPKIESVLLQLANASDREDFAQVHNLHMENGNVRVVVDLLDETSKLPGYAVEETRYRDKVQVLVPVEKITALAQETNVTFIRAPLEPYPANTSNATAVQTSPPKSGFHTAIPFALTIILIFMIRRIRK